MNDALSLCGRGLAAQLSCNSPWLPSRRTGITDVGDSVIICPQLEAPHHRARLETVYTSLTEGNGTPYRGRAHHSPNAHNDIIHDRSAFPQLLCSSLSRAPCPSRSYLCFAAPFCAFRIVISHLSVMPGCALLCTARPLFPTPTPDFAFPSTLSSARRILLLHSPPGELSMPTKTSCLSPPP